MKTNKKWKVQRITDAGKWPYIGDAYVNKDGSINVYLDEGVAVSGGEKLHIKPAREKAEASDDEATAV
jgi:hypothetical protein